MFVCERERKREREEIVKKSDTSSMSDWLQKSWSHSRTFDLFCNRSHALKNDAAMIRHLGSSINDVTNIFILLIICFANELLSMYCLANSELILFKI